MKRVLLAFIFLIYQTSYGQDINIKIGHNYQFITNNSLLFNSEQKLESVYDNLKVFSKQDNQENQDKHVFKEAEIKNESIEEGLIVKVNYIDDGRVYFSYWKFDEDDERNEIFSPSEKVFSLSIDKFSKITRERFNKFIGWQIKPFTIPIRLRGLGKDIFEFETNFSLGSSIASGIRYNLLEENRYVELTAGIGITKVNLKPSNSNLQNETLSPAAFTIAIGGLFHYDQANLGIFIGWDKISGEEQKKYEWQHNGALWLGLGLNIGILKSSRGLNTKEGTQPPN